MALITTFATTPLVTFLYPPWYQKKIAAWRRGEIDWDGNPLNDNSGSSEHADSLQKSETAEIRKLLVYLGLDTLPSIFTFMSLLGGGKPSISKTHPRIEETPSEAVAQELSPTRPLAVHGVRMLQLSERLSSVMKESEIDDYSLKDPVINVFRTFGQLNNVAVSGDVEIAPEGSEAEILARSAIERASDMVLLPLNHSGSLLESEDCQPLSTGSDTIYGSNASSTFVSSFLSKTSCNTALFINNGFGVPVPRGDDNILSRSISKLSLRSHQGITLAPIADRSHHIFFPFFGGPDDHMALRLVLRLAQNSNVTATILHVNMAKDTVPAPEVETTQSSTSYRVKSGVKVSVTPSEEMLIEQELAFYTSMKDSLPHELRRRVKFEYFSPQPSLQSLTEKAKSEVGQSPKNAGDLIILGRGRGVQREFKHELLDLKSSMNYFARSGPDSQCFGDLAEALIITQVKASLIVIQAQNSLNIGSA